MSHGTVAQGASNWEFCTISPHKTTLTELCVDEHDRVSIEIYTCSATIYVCNCPNCLSTESTVLRICWLVVIIIIIMNVFYSVQFPRRNFLWAQYAEFFFELNAQNFSLSSMRRIFLWAQCAEIMLICLSSEATVLWICWLVVTIMLIWFFLVIHMLTYTLLSITTEYYYSSTGISFDLLMCSKKNLLIFRFTHVAISPLRLCR